MFDLRLPSGYFFVIVGALLIAMGFRDADVDLYGGIFMFFFGGALLLLAWRRPAKVD
jgi:hypothetical protein